MASKQSATKAAWFLIGFLSALLCVAAAMGITKSLPRVTKAVQGGWSAHVVGPRRTQLDSSLQSVRGQIGLYRGQHQQRGPELDESGRLDPARFVNRLTQKTDANGKLIAEGRFGPYMAQMPDNPFASTNAWKVSVGAGPAPGDGSSGWHYDTRTGRFSANDSKANVRR